MAIINNEHRFIEIEQKSSINGYVEFCIVRQSNVCAKFAPHGVFSTPKTAWRLMSIAHPAVNSFEKVLFVRGTVQSWDRYVVQAKDSDFEEIKKAIDAYNEAYALTTIPEYNSKVYCITKRNNIKPVRYNKTNIKKYKVLATEIDDLM